MWIRWVLSVGCCDSKAKNGARNFAPFLRGKEARSGSGERRSGLPSDHAPNLLTIRMTHGYYTTGHNGALLVACDSVLRCRLSVRNLCTAAAPLTPAPKTSGEAILRLPQLVSLLHVCEQADANETGPRKRAASIRVCHILGDWAGWRNAEAARPRVQQAIAYSRRVMRGSK